MSFPRTCLIGAMLLAAWPGARPAQAAGPAEVASPAEAAGPADTASAADAAGPSAPASPDRLPGVIGATELYSADTLTGVALRGFDPVSCLFGEPQPGVAGVELRWRGLVWRFASEANRAAFARAPDDFVPQFAGYDPVSVADGIATAGDPRSFLVLDGRLYLFRDAASRDRFTADRRAAAEARWPGVFSGLVRS